MTKKMTVFLVAMICLSTAQAQKETKKFSVGFGIEAGVPTGAAADAYTFATGLTLRLSWKAGPGFVTLTSGLIGYAPKLVDGVKPKAGLQIPVRVGYKYIIQHHLFLMGEVGYSDFNTYYGSKGAIVSSNYGSMLVSPSFGYQAGAFEIGLRYSGNLSNGGSVAGLRIGFNF
jgi:hypothetical protein